PLSLSPSPPTDPSTLSLHDALPISTTSPRLTALGLNPSAASSSSIVVFLSEFLLSAPSPVNFSFLVANVWYRHSLRCCGLILTQIFLQENKEEKLRRAKGRSHIMPE